MSTILYFCSFNISQIMKTEDKSQFALIDEKTGKELDTGSPFDWFGDEQFWKKLDRITVSQTGSGNLSS